MNTLREAAQQALEALESYATHRPLPGRCPVRDAEYALRAALAQQDDEPQRPKCFEFALDFLGAPESVELRAYIEQLEGRAALAQEQDEPTGKQSLQVDRGLNMNTPQAAQRLLDALAAAMPYAPHRAEFDRVADAADDLRKALAQTAPQQDPELSAALGYPGSISEPVMNRVELLRMVAKMRVEFEQPIGFIPRDQYDFLLRSTNGVNTRIELTRQYPFVVPIYVKPQ